MIFRTCLFFAMFSVLSVSAQDPEEEANAYFSKKNYADALPVYEKLFNQEPDNVDYNFRLAICYLKAGTNTKNAVFHLEYISRKKSNDPQIWYNLGLAYQYSGRFDDAIVAYERIKRLGDNKLVVLSDRQIETCYNAKEMVKYPLDVTFQNLGKSINSVFPDYYPLIPADESFMIFTARRQTLNTSKELDGFYASDIYMAAPKEGLWTNIKAISSQINTVYDEKAVDLSSDGKKMIVYLDRIDSLGNIYYSENQKMGFQKIIRFQGEINSYFETSGTLSENEKMIVFASNRPGGYGGTDLYVANKLPNGNWGVPVNLGSNINSKYNEDFPHLSRGGQLYFASEGFSSMGGFDVFKSLRDENTGSWQTPQNLGYPLNNSYDNMNITFVGDSSIAYMSTIREDAIGDLDIYKVMFNQKYNRYCIITGTVSLNDTLSSKIKTQILVSKSNSTEVLKYAPVKRSGRYVMALPPGAYNIKVTAEGFQDFSVALTIYDVPFQAELTKNFMLTKLPVPKKE